MDLYLNQSKLGSFSLMYDGDISDHLKLEEHHIIQVANSFVAYGCTNLRQSFRSMSVNNLKNVLITILKKYKELHF